MSFRDDHDAALARISALEGELAQRATLERELATAREEIVRLRAGPPPRHWRMGLLPAWLTLIALVLALIFVFGYIGLWKERQVKQLRVDLERCQRG